MKKLIPLIPCLLAVVISAVVSIFLPGGTISFLSCFFVVPVALITAITWCISTKGSRWRPLAMSIIPAALYVALTLPDIPLRITFHAYRAEFDKIAMQIEKGNPPETPFWIGPFKINMAGRRGETGTPYLASNKEKWEINGFVRHPKGQGFNLWSCVKLDDSWSYIEED